MAIWTAKPDRIDGGNMVVKVFKDGQEQDELFISVDKAKKEINDPEKYLDRLARNYAVDQGDILAVFQNYEGRTSLSSEVQALVDAGAIDDSTAKMMYRVLTGSDNTKVRNFIRANDDATIDALLGI